MSNIVLSSGVRQSLLSLQQTSAQQATVQLRLATGKKVNSAIDNPVNFFTSQSLDERSSQLSALLDGMSNAVQTITAASKAIDSITTLVKSLQSTITQAQSDAAQNRPAKTSGALSTAAESVAANAGLRDVALAKSLVGNGDGTADPATSTSAGDLGIATATNLAMELKAGNTTFDFQFDPTTATVQDVVNAINSSGLATASVGNDGKLTITGTGSDTLQVGFGSGASAAAAITSAQAGTLNTNFGLAATDYTTGISASGNSTVRANLVEQFNTLRTQIDQLASDAGYNGTNLLNGDKLSVVFNEKTGTSQTKLDIQGSKLTSTSLGIDQAVNGTATTGQFNIQDDTSLATASANLTNALSSLQSLASTLGANLSVVQTRQDFTKGMVTVLQTGSDNLVKADQNEEGANLLALNTRQQLSQTTLSLASQADQSVLRLFG